MSDDILVVQLPYPGLLPNLMGWARVCHEQAQLSAPAGLVFRQSYEALADDLDRAVAEIRRLRKELDDEQ